MGTYQLVFPTYNMLLTISSAGLPVAISRMVSFALAKDDPRTAKRVFKVALCLLSALYPPSRALWPLHPHCCWYA